MLQKYAPRPEQKKSVEVSFNATNKKLKDYFL
jgi:hypothetical protein